jgi:hypothetical protein
VATYLASKGNEFEWRGAWGLVWKVGAVGQWGEVGGEVGRAVALVDFYHVTARGDFDSTSFQLCVQSPALNVYKVRPGTGDISILQAHCRSSPRRRDASPPLPSPPLSLAPNARWRGFPLHDDATRPFPSPLHDDASLPSSPLSTTTRRRNPPLLPPSLAPSASRMGSRRRRPTSSPLPRSKRESEGVPLSDAATTPPPSLQARVG